MKTVKACLTLVLAAHLLVCAVFCVSGTVAQGADGQGGESYLFSGHIKVRNTEYFFKIRRGETIRDAAKTFGNQHGFSEKIVNELVRDMETHLGAQQEPTVPIKIQKPAANGNSDTVEMEVDAEGGDALIVGSKKDAELQEKAKKAEAAQEERTKQNMAEQEEKATEARVVKEESMHKKMLEQDEKNSAEEMAKSETQEKRVEEEKAKQAAKEAAKERVRAH